MFGRLNPFFPYPSVTWKELERMGENELEEKLPKIFRQMILATLIVLILIIIFVAIINMAY